MFAIGEAARLSGVTIETIRYYERSGIIGRAERSTSGRRVFTDADVAELRFIRRCRDLGFSIRNACALRDLSRAPAPTCTEAEAVAARHLGEVRKKIEELQRLETALEELIANCSDGSVECPLLQGLAAG